MYNNSIMTMHNPTYEVERREWWARAMTVTGAGALAIGFANLFRASAEVADTVQAGAYQTAVEMAVHSPEATVGLGATAVGALALVARGAFVRAADRIRDNVALYR
jgi:hypothetical protein